MPRPEVIMRMRSGALALYALTTFVPAAAQEWDLPATAAKWVSAESGEKLKLTVESRFRYETRTGQSFGKDPDLSLALVRHRFGATYKPVSWLKLSGMVQDSRAPFYGPNAPNTLRDSADLHEAYFELFPDRKKGFGFSGGRMMLNYGEGRLLGTPQWSNLARTYDQARAYWRSPRMQLEMLFASPVKIRSDEFNRPVLGDRVWGMYNVLPNVAGKQSLEFYILRHDQNRAAGFTGGNTLLGTDRLGVNTFGGRFFGPLAHNLKYSLEGALQNGRVGPATHRAAAWFSSLTRRWTVAGRPFDLSGEYKFASGTNNPQDASRVTTFDQLYPANHDKFGHEDLFGWRNIHNARALATLGWTKNFSVNLMYNNLWLASARDSLYSGAGKSIARSAGGTAGRHVGQETDVFAAYKWKRFTLGAGYGHLFAGEFLRKATTGVGPNYAYLFHTYSF